MGGAPPHGRSEEQRTDTPLTPARDESVSRLSVRSGLIFESFPKVHTEVQRGEQSLVSNQISLHNLKD